MKKIFIILSLIFLTGCGRESLTCTYTNDKDGIKSEEVITTNFSNDKIVTMKGIIKTTYDDPTNIDLSYQTIKSMMDSINTYDGISAVSSKSDKIITTTVNIDYQKVDKDVLDKLQISKSEVNASKKDVLNSYENAGYSCK